VSKLSKAGFSLAVLAMVYLIGLLLLTSAPLNLATWTLWLIVNTSLAASLYRSEKPYELMAAYTVGTAIIAAIAVYNYTVGTTPLSWGIAETVTVVTVLIALVAWRFTTNDVGVIMTTIAMVIAGVPTWIDAYYRPESQSVLFWSVNALACVLSYFGAPPKFVARFMPLCGGLANCLIAVLALRQFA